MRRIFTSKKKSREAIEKEAFAAMRKAKAAIDPGVLAKVRAAIEKSPMAEQLMGMTKKKENAVQPVEVDDDQVKKEKALEAARKAHGNVKEQEVEAVDQAKMLDIVAKTLQLNPHNSGLKKGVKDILSDK